jgi:H+/gluconate symporter-like permease
VALIFGSMAATLVSLFFIPILMDNARAMMPDDFEEPNKKTENKEPSKFLKYTQKILTTIWSLFIKLLINLYKLIKNAIGSYLSKRKEKKSEEDKKTK